MPTKINNLPPVEYLEECFLFDRDTGILTWKTRPLSHFETTHHRNIWNTRHACKPAGNLRSSGYLNTGINGKLYPNHRIIWKMATRLDPIEEIDHINGNPSDNRLCNLREASKSRNRCNSGVGKHNLLQVKGAENSMPVFGLKEPQKLSAPTPR
jgi:hypothetical protein